MKKFVLLLLALLAAIAIFHVQITDYIAKEALAKKDYAGVLNMANLKKVLMGYESAEALYRRILAENPKGSQAEDCHYMIGFCLDRRSKPDEAIAAFNAYLALYPEGKWKANALKRISTLKANSSND